MSPVQDPWSIAADMLDVQAVQSQWTTNPNQWVLDQFGAEPDEWQAEGLEALASGKHIAVRSGHGVGKTAFLAWIILWWLDTKGYCKIPCAAPTEHQLTDLLWPEMNIWLTRSADHGGLNERMVWKASRVFVLGRERAAFAVQRAAGPDNKPENLAGFHSDNLLFVVDEASGVADRNMTVVTGALTTEGAQLVMTGNPTRATGFFAKRFTDVNPEKWHVRTVSSLGSPRVDNDWADSVANEWGRESDEYRVRVQGLPPRGDARGFMTPELVESAQSVERRDSIPKEGPLVLGVDVARYGRDSSVISARRGMNIFEFKKYQKLGNPSVAQKVLDTVARLASPDETVRVLVDDDGVGGGVTDLLVIAMRNRDPDLATISVSGVSFGGAGNKWYTNNTGIWWARLRRMMQEGVIAIPKSDELYQELTDRTSAVNMKGKTVLESKDHMKARGVPSPDIADSIVLTIADQNQGTGFLDYWKRSSGKVEDLMSKSMLEVDPATLLLEAESTNCHHFFGPPDIVTGDRHCIKCRQVPQPLTP